MSPEQWKAAAIFALTYALISGRRLRVLPLNRPASALLGVALMVAAGVMTPSQVYASIDYDTLVLLLGMMILAAYFHLAGFYRWAAAWIPRVAATPRRLLLGVMIASSVLSCLLVNDTVCLLFTPLLVMVLVRAGLPLPPYLLALAMSANIGSLATLVGNPQNMVIGRLGGLEFAAFSAAMVPVALAGLAIQYAILSVGFRKELDKPLPDPSSLPRAEPPDPRLLGLSGLALAGAFVGFFAGWDPPWTAMGAAAALMVAARRDTHEVLKLVDWHLLVFFAALFAVVGGIREAGLMQPVLAGLPDAGASGASRAWALAGVTVAGSNLFSNVPFVLLAGAWVGGMSDADLLWKVLAMSATFAGNLTLLGSVANLIVVESAREHCEIGFWDYAKFGIPITLLTVGAGMLLLLAWG